MADNFDTVFNSNLEIYSSRDRIRAQLSSYAKEYLQVNSIDLYKTSYLSYLIDILSIMASNQMFYSSTVYKEFFMIEAQLSESVYNLARWIGYSPEKAQAATLNVMVTIPLTFPSNDVSFIIPSNFHVYSTNGTKYLIDTKYNYSSPLLTSYQFVQTDSPQNATLVSDTVRIINNSVISVRSANGFSYPVYLDTLRKNASFIIPFTQHEKIIKQFIIPTNLEFYQFFSKKINFNGMVEKILVYVHEPAYNETFSIQDETAYRIIDNNSLVIDSEMPVDGGIVSNTSVNTYSTNDQWTESEAGLYTLSSSDKEYYWTYSIDKGEIYFGNGIIGRQPKPGSVILLIIYVTKGEQGQAVPGAITKGDNLYYLNTQGSEIVPVSSKLYRITYNVINTTPSEGGKNIQTLPEVKKSAIVNLRAKKRLVSDSDYDDINEVMGADFPAVESVPILKRSDIKVNEIMTFLRLIYHDENNIPQIVPTRNIFLRVDNATFIDNKYTVTRKTFTDIDSERYETFFNMTIDKRSMVATYDYIVYKLYDSPVYVDSTTDYLSSQKYIKQVYIIGTTADYTIDLIANPSGTISTSSSSGSPTPTNEYPLKIRFNVNHIPESIPYNPPAEYSNYPQFRCRMITKWDTNQEYTMIPKIQRNSDPTLPDKYLYFEAEIPDYLNVPLSTQRFEYVIDLFAQDPDWLPEEHPDETILDSWDWRPLQTYFSDVIIRKDLGDIMMSTVTTSRLWDGICHDHASYFIHNVPVIMTNYLDDGHGNGVYNKDSQRTFEYVVLQKLMSSLVLQEKRMLTDFVNIKFPDTHGTLNNLKYNKLRYQIQSRTINPWTTDYNTSSSSTSYPLTAGMKFIIKEALPPQFTDGLELKDYINYIATYYFDLQGDPAWRIISPSRDMYVNVVDEFDNNSDYKVLAYDGDGWIDVQTFTIPLKIVAKIRISPTSAISTSGIVSIIKEQLMNYFLPRFGMDVSLDRSEIISVIRSVSGVMYCELINPSIDIRFTYELKDLTQSQLLDYSPQYVGFTRDDITILVDYT